MRLRSILPVTVTAALALTVAATHAAATTAPCPTHPASTVSPNRWPPAHLKLLPPGATTLRLCRFDGYAGTSPPKLASSSEITSTKLIAQLTHDLNALPAYLKLALPCPMDNGAQVDVLATYRDGEHVTVDYESTGCNRVTNGDVVRIANGYRDEALAARLRRELGAPGYG